MDFWIDAHSHLADRRWTGDGDQIAPVISEAKQAGIKYFLQGGVDPSDWNRQLDLQKRDPAILPAFGLHPYFVAAHSETECEVALDELAQKIPKAYAIGETGLDFRPQYLEGKDSSTIGGSESRQIAMFEAQLEIANVIKKPVILHVVRAFDKAVQVVDLFLEYRKDCGMVHSFNGSVSQALGWVERGFLISIGGPVCRPDNQKLHQAVKAIPAENLVLETDSPDQAPPDWKATLNQPLSLLKVAEKVAEIRGMTLPELRATTSQNLLRLLPNLKA